MQNVYTVEETADILKLKPSTVREWLRMGKLRGVKIGKVWRIRESDINEFLEAHARGGEQETESD